MLESFMCGLVGTIKGGPDKLLSVLKKLQYRGYDSFGIAVADSGSIICRKGLGEVKTLNFERGETGIGHTRWATNGKVSLENAHPIVHGNIAVVQNGIIENYAFIREKYANFPWATETDTECILALLAGKRLDLNAMEFLLKELKGEFAILILEPKTESIYFAKKGSNPILIDVEGRMISSDISAFSCRTLIDVADRQFGRLSAGGLEISPSEIVYREHSPALAETKMTHQTWFESEFFEQIDLLKKIHPKFAAAKFPIFKQIDIIGCGSAYLVGKLGEWWLDILTDIRARAHFSSEFRVKYSECLVAISQSGETADTLKALKRSSAKTKIGVINSMGSTMCGYVDKIVATGAGREVSVASTKSTTAQMLAMFSWACHIRDAEGEKTDEYPSGRELFQGFLEIIPKMREFVDFYLPKVESIEPLEHVFILGSGGMFPIAMEAALKIKELSYVHAEAISCAEMKHGPIAMIDERVLVLCLCPKWEPIIDEIISRGAKVIVLTAENLSDKIQTIQMPKLDEIYSPFMYVLCAQWLANSWGKRFGNRIDMPRNLAKAVTVS